ncbi:MAG TPA: helix-turn-helix transcriptional regulator [Streptosporangiaceae bacterium]|nr:helix-turn-helix transcriptional regulator [Streptosporangiaceae bacterium]
MGAVGQGDRGATLVARGLANVQIGRELFVSEATVKAHLMRACAKLGVTGRTAAVTKAMDIGAPPRVTNWR